jgi:hypothetical protein
MECHSFHLCSVQIFGPTLFNTEYREGNFPYSLLICIDEHRLRVFENRVLRSIFGPKGEEVAGGWRRLHNEELPNLHASPNIIRVISQGG